MQLAKTGMPLCAVLPFLMSYFVLIPNGKSKHLQLDLTFLISELFFFGAKEDLLNLGQFPQAKIAYPKRLVVELTTYNC